MTMMRNQIVDALTMADYRVESWGNPTLHNLINNGPVCLIRYLGLQGKSPNRVPKSALTVLASGAYNTAYADGQGLEELEKALIDVLNTIGLYPELDSTVISYSDGELTTLTAGIKNRFVAMTILVAGDPV